jgi:hypothetical protein
MSIPPLSHRALRIRKTRSLTLTGWQWRWRTEWVKNGQVGVWSETYRDERDCDSSIRAHRVFFADADLITVDRKTGTTKHERHAGA